MDTIKLKNSKVKMVAHRGVSGIECENTNAAFVAAGNRSYFGIETDVHKTKDGKFVVIHDSDLKRITDNKYDSDVEKLNYDDFKDVILPDIDGSYNRTDLRIPYLSDYVKICKKYDKYAVCELKSEFTKDELKKIVEIFKDNDYLYHTIFIDFKTSNLIPLREMLPKQNIQLLTGEFNDEVLETLIKYNFDLDTHIDAVNKDMVEILHKNNILINCWTCNDKEKGEELIEMGVDYITTNILE